MRSREKEDAMTPEFKMKTYWAIGIVGVIVVLVVLAYVSGYFDPAATGAS